ncbi:UNVERIFIED_CONTAM: hypothetical protein FKN15_027999 [Acipenser sinensis]
MHAWSTRPSGGVAPNPGEPVIALAGLETPSLAPKAPQKHRPPSVRRPAANQGQLDPTPGSPNRRKRKPRTGRARQARGGPATPLGAAALPPPLPSQPPIVTFLVHRVGGQGIRTGADKISAVRDWPSQSASITVPKLDCVWVGPCRVLETLGELIYRVQFPNHGWKVVLHQD